MNVFACVRVLAVACALVLAQPAGAQSTQVIHGRVLDAVTGQPLAGASVRAVGTRVGAITAADGTFAIATQAATLRAEIIGYAAAEAAPTDGMVLSLAPAAIPLAGAEVNSHLATEGHSPTAFTNLDRQDIQRDY